MAEAKRAFYSAIKRADVGQALARYAEARSAALATTHMTSALVSLSAENGKRGTVRRLWRSHRAGGDAARLNEYLCCDFIKGFTRLGDHNSAAHVLRAARAQRLANTEVRCRTPPPMSVPRRRPSPMHIGPPSGLVQVYNSFLTACAKLHSGPEAVRTVECILAQMDEDGVQPDGFTGAIAVGVYGDAGDLAAAQGFAARAGADDVVVSNALLRAAARADNAPLALALLQRMEENGPAPDLVSYNTALHAVRARASARGQAALGPTTRLRRPAPSSPPLPAIERPAAAPAQVASASTEALAAHPIDRVAVAQSL
eukprot:6747251-Prymnesium_polylepis.1